MAYDRDDFRSRPSGRDRQYSRDTHGRDENRSFGGRGGQRDEDRGFFERAGDEISSWFGGHDDDHHSEGGWNRDERNRSRSEPWGGGGDSNRSRDQNRDRNYRPMAGDYGRSEQMMGRGGSGGGGRDFETRPSPQPRNESSNHPDPHYQSWRQQQIEALDRDYDEYRREHQSRFESDFGSWRERRVSKRSLLQRIREQMEVVGNDDQHVGTVDRVAGDRIILTKSDPESGGVHHSLSCADIDRIEENRIILDWTAEESKNRWRDENRSRALFEREDQGEAGPRILDKSFEGTYR